MARVVVLALACVTLASGARYVDYSAVKVPEYGVAADYDGPRDVSASDEYRDPSTDSSVSLDYKYDEIPRRSEKSVVAKEIPQSNGEDGDSWPKRERKTRRKTSNDDGNLETLDKYSPLEMIPKFHQSDRLSIRPNNIRLRKPDREPKVQHTRASKFKARKDEFQDDFDSEENVDLHEDYVYDKKSNFGNMATTTRGKKARRKPRDRYVKSREVDDTIEGNQDLLENPDNSNKNYLEYFEDRKVLDLQNRRPEASDEDHKLIKGYPDLTDKRQFYPVQMEKKNPSDFLLDTDSEIEKMRPEFFDISGKQFDTVDPEARQKFSGGRRFGGISNEGKRKETHILKNLDDRGSDKREKSKPRTFHQQEQQYDSDEDYEDMKRVQNIKSKLPSLSRRTTKATTRATQRWEPSTQDVQLDWKNRRVFVPEPEKRETTTSSTSTTTTTTSTSSTTTTKAFNLITTTPSTTLLKEELSLAEKSRLSILKKALRKESSANTTSTNKPPVLMQLAANMPTLAIVEPASSQEPLFRAREVFDDDPSQLEKVKRLMRHKLVSNAKDIRELTDNWDEMVCDYIDTSLLDSASSNSISSILLLPFLLVL